MSVAIEIPEQFARSFGNTDEEVRRNAKIELAVAMYRDGRWSTGKASKFTGLYIGKFIDILRDKNVPRPYTKELLDEEFRHAEMFSKVIQSKQSND